MVDMSFGIKKNVAVTIPIGKFYKGATVIPNATLAAGDVIIHIGLTANEANIGTLPTLIGNSTTEYKQALTQAETNEDVIIINYRDAAGGEWDPFDVILFPTTYMNSEVPSVVADSVWNETLADHLAAGSTGEALDDMCCPLGSGASLNTYTVLDGAGNPIQGVAVTVTTDVLGTNPIAYGVTDMAGEIDFWLDTGTYYMWSAKSGYTFTNPDTEVVP